MHKIKKYANGRFYDTTDKKYITLKQLSEMIKEGETEKAKKAEDFLIKKAVKLEEQKAKKQKELHQTAKEVHQTAVASMAK